MAALENLYPVVRTPSQARVAVGQLIGATRAPVEVRAVAAGWLGGRSARELVRLDDHARGYLPDDAPRRAAWRLGRSGGGWDRVESDLRAAADVDHDLATLGRAGLRSWLSVGAATAWQRLPAAQAERIGFLVDFAGLDEDTTRSVRFHAGPAHRP